MKIWPPELTAELAILWDDGLSGTAIAKKLGRGLTKNAIIGKARRIGLPPRGCPLNARNGPPRPVHHVSLVGDPASDSSAPCKPGGDTEPIPVRVRRCLWIEDEPTADDSCYRCPHKALPGKPYCEEHYRRSIVGKGSQISERQGRVRRG